MTLPAFEFTLQTTALVEAAPGRYTPGVDLMLNDDGDLDMTGGLMSFTTGLQAVKQGAQLRCGLWRGEWFLNLDKGIPYWQDILGQKFDPVQEAKIRNPFRAELLDTPGVLEIVSLSTAFDPATRQLRVAWELRGDEGVASGNLSQVVA